MLTCGTGGIYRSTFMSTLHRAARGALCILFVVALGGWGSSEADQRKALIAFLQDINSRAGAHVLVPNANDEKAFGPYLQHYAIILDFNKAMKSPTDDFMAQLIKLGYGPNPVPRTIEQMAAAPADLTATKTSSTRWSRASKRGWRKRPRTVPRSSSRTI